MRRKIEENKRKCGRCNEEDEVRSAEVRKRRRRSTEGRGKEKEEDGREEMRGRGGEEGGGAKKRGERGRKEGDLRKPLAEWRRRRENPVMRSSILTVYSKYSRD